MIKWYFVSPVLQTVSGLVEVHHSPSVGKLKLLARFKTTCKPGSIGYESLDNKGVSTVVLDAIRPQLDNMVRSYRNGVILNKDTYTWITKENQVESREAFNLIPHSCIEVDKCFEWKAIDDSMKGLLL